jgi:hypothetical protein
MIILELTKQTAETETSASKPPNEKDKTVIGSREDEE